MRCTSNIIPLTNNKKETIRLYVTTSSFVLVKDEKNILEIHFDGHRMTKRGRFSSSSILNCVRRKLTHYKLDSFVPVNIVQSYDIYGILGFVEGFRGKINLFCFGNLATHSNGRSSRQRYSK
jgi:hypothetical protein